MTQPEQVPTTPAVGRHGGVEASQVIPQPEVIPVEPIVGKDGGETTLRHEA